MYKRQGNGFKAGLESKFKGENVTVFMYFIMTQIPPGLRALATIGVLSAAISTVNSGLNSMSSVLIQDFYRPFVSKISEKPKAESHFVKAGQFGMAIIGVFLFAMAILSYTWQKSQYIPTVSYTHLDVYKRQPFNIPNSASSIWGVELLLDFRVMPWPVEIVFFISFRTCLLYTSRCV